MSTLARPPRTPEAVLFDFDGTLAMLTLDFNAMRHSAYSALKQALPPEELANYDTSKPVMEALSGLLAGYPPQKAAQVNDIVEQNLIAFEVEAARKSRLFPFTIPVLNRLKARGIPSAIITRNCRDSINIVFPDHADYCACLVARHDVSQVKPHPEHLLAALEPLGVAPEKALMVGDHPMDIIAARNTGCLSAGVLTGEADATSIKKANPDWLAENIEELMQVLDI
ncbi:HAD family hydrolase [Desulfovibrio sp. OttesenSCG-928-C06]|nr:HAD family hydrolase [Desulfovibrio sp. OttesenSCG-928-C06]